MVINVDSFFNQKGLLTSKYKIMEADISTDNVKTGEQIYDKIKESMKDIFDPLRGMSDKEKTDYEERISQKIKNGEKLSGEEMRYIQLKNPDLYAMVLRIQMQRQALENKLKNCRSKEEVKEAYEFSVSHIAKDDPAREPLQAAYNNVTKEFKKTSQYRNLPERREDGDKKEKIPVTQEYKSGEFKSKSKYVQIGGTFSVVDIKA
jgi:hypothetical protein